LKEQLEITKTQKSQLEQQAHELKKLKDTVLSLETKVEGKDEEIKELKVKNINEVNKHREQVKKLREFAEHCEKELIRKRTEMKDAKVELQKRQSEIRLAKKAIEKKQIECRKGRNMVMGLQNQKKRMYEELQKYKKRSALEARSGPHLSFQLTLSEVLENNDKNVKIIETLTKNYSLLKIEYDKIIDHFISCYTEVHNNFRHLREIQQEEAEQKKETIDIPAIKMTIYNRQVDVLCLECQSNFDNIKSLSLEFQKLTGKSLGAIL